MSIGQGVSLKIRLGILLFFGGYFLQSLVFCNHFEELQTIINNAPLTYVYLNTIKTCLTPNYLFLAGSYYNLLTQHQLQLRI